jgi:hypothetical protein
MNMKQLLFLAAILTAAGASTSAEEYYLVNESDATVYILEAPADLSDYELSPQARYRQLPPRGVLPYDPGRPVAGFAYSRGTFQLPTIAIEAPELERRLRVTESDRRYASITPEDLTTDRVVSPSAFADLLSYPRIDDQYLDWVGREARIARGRGRAPLGVYADFGEGREMIDLATSLLWQRGGTDLQWLKTHATEDDYFLGASVYTAFAPGTTVFLYLYETGSDIPAATIELQAGSGGTRMVLLWTPARPQPTVVGTMVASQFFLEAQIWRSAFAATIGVPVGELTVETATASSAAGIWEEFVLARDEFTVVFGE